MNLKLTKGWRIINSEQSFRLEYEHKSKKGEIFWRLEGYYSTLGHALESFVESMLRVGSVETLKECRIP